MAMQLTKVLLLRRMWRVSLQPLAPADLLHEPRYNASHARISRALSRRVRRGRAKNKRLDAVVWSERCPALYRRLQGAIGANERASWHRVSTMMRPHGAACVSKRARRSRESERTCFDMICARLRAQTIRARDNSVTHIPHEPRVVRLLAFIVVACCAEMARLSSLTSARSAISNMD